MLQHHTSKASMQARRHGASAPARAPLRVRASASSQPSKLILPSSAAPTPSSITGMSKLVIPGSPAPVNSVNAARTPGSVATSAAAATAAPFTQGPLIFYQGKRVHSLHDKGMDVINSMGDWAETDLMRYLRSSDKCWQPQDYLPDPASPDFFDQLQVLRKGCENIPPEYFVVLVGDMITEEALPSYMAMLNRMDGTKDESGAQDHAWARWTRWWVAEENRHGDLLNKYLYLSGKVDMRAIEASVQRLISTGLDPQLENNPYLLFVYTSFQERATKISHGNTARLATSYGDPALCQLCASIAADESRHEAAYTNIVDQFFKRDPEGAVLAFADMMRKGIVMPAHLVDDGVHSTNNGRSANLFLDYASVADSIGVYTTRDYAKIVEHLVARWGISELRHLSGAAAEAQDFLLSHAQRVHRLADIQAERKLRDKKRGKNKMASFSWVFGRNVQLQ